MNEKSMSAAKHTPGVRITPTMLAALVHLAAGRSLRGAFSATTFSALRRHGLIEDADTITEAGRAAIAKATGSQA